MKNKEEKKVKKKSIKIFNLICLIIVLFSNIMPNITLAAGKKGTFEVYNISTYIQTTKNSEYYGICRKKNL